MRFTIEPMSMGEILSRAISLLIARLGVFLAIEAIAVTPTLILQLALPDVATGQAASLLVLPMIILGPIGSAAMLYVITREYLGETVSLSEAFSFSLQMVPTSRHVNPLLARHRARICGLLVPGIYLAIVWAFISQIVVMENRPAATRLVAARTLCKGILTVFGLLFVVVLCEGCINSVIALGLRTVLPFEENVQVDNYINYAIYQIVVTFFNGIGQTFIAICTTLLYFDLRNRKEAFDMSGIITWMAQYRDWRDEPAPGEAANLPASTETGIKSGDVAKSPIPPETGIQDTTAPPSDNIQS